MWVRNNNYNISIRIDEDSPKVFRFSMDRSSAWMTSFLMALVNQLFILNQTHNLHNYRQHCLNQDQIEES